MIIGDIYIFRSLDVCMSAQSCQTLCDPIDCTPACSSVHGIFQAKILEWVAIFSSRESSLIIYSVRYGPCINLDSLICFFFLGQNTKSQMVHYQNISRDNVIFFLLSVFLL